MRMMIAALCFAIAAKEPLLAFVARIYYPPGDRRISHYEVYVSDLHGRHRRKLTSGKDDVLSVHWIGQSAITWTASDGRCFVSGLHPFRPVAIFVPDNFERYGVFRDRLLCADRFKVERQTSTGSAYTVPDRCLEITLFGTKKVKAPELPVRNVSWDQDRAVYMAASHEITIADETGTIEVDGKSFRFSFDGALPPEPIEIRDGTLFIYRVDVAGAHGRDYTAYGLHLETGRAAKLFDPIGYVDFDPNSAYYEGMSFGGRGSIPYGPKKQVWAAKLYAGNWQTGNRWLVLGGIVHVTCVAVQPER